MTAPASGLRPAPKSRGWLAFYRLQAQLMWEWRPSRLAVVRRATLTFLGSCVALGITAALLPGLRIDGPGTLLAAALLLAAIDSAFALILHWLLVGWPLVVAQLLGIVGQLGAIIGVGRVLPGVHVADMTTAIWGAVLLTLANSTFAELVAVSDDDSYYSVLVRKLVAREFGHPRKPVPGLLVVQIDGLSLPVLREAIRASRASVLGRLLRDGEATLRPWVALLPPTTPASQAGILHGRNDDIAGFRWYEKATGRLLVANHPEDAAEIVRRISDGKGLLADDGAGIGNLVTGDATRSYLTMATIEQSAPPDDDRRMRGFFVTTVNYIRLLVLMAGEVVKELYQAERQRASGVEPRMHRDVRFAIERAATNIAMRTVSTALVIEEMYAGAPTVYVDYTGYDVIAHHCGPERVEAIDALEGIDRSVGSLVKAARSTNRPYRIVVLSDHGQCLGATFRQRFGRTLEEVIAEQLPGEPTVVGTADAVESGSYGRRIAAEFGRGSGLGPLVARHLPSGLRRAGGPRSGDGDATPPDVVIASSGNLAHVYFTAAPGPMTSDAVEARHPGLIQTLARHPGIGAVVGRSADGHGSVLDADGSVDLSALRSDEGGQLAAYGPRAAEAIQRLAAFPNSGDLILLGAVDPVTQEVVGFEELIGSHGGLGGWQAEPFILSPTELRFADEAPLGAPALYRQIVAWQAQLRGEQAQPRDESAS